MSATSTKSYPAGFTPAFEDKNEEGKLINPYVLALSGIGEPFSSGERAPSWQWDLDEEFWEKTKFHAQIVFQPPAQVGLNESVPEVAILKMLRPTDNHWKAVEVSFSLQPEVSDGEAEPDLSDFQPLVLTDADAFHVKRSPVDNLLMYFAVKDFKYPKTGRFRAKFQIKVHAGFVKDMADYGGYHLKWFEDSTDHRDIQKNAVVHAGVAVSEVVTEVKEGAETVIAAGHKSFEEFLKLEGHGQGLVPLLPGDMEKRHKTKHRIVKPRDHLWKR